MSLEELFDRHHQVGVDHGLTRAMNIVVNSSSLSIPQQLELVEKMEALIGKPLPAVPVKLTS